MVIQLNIEDEILTEKISEYINVKHKAFNELMIEALENFFSTAKSSLNYEVEDIDKNSSVIDFGLNNDIEDIKLFQDIDNVQNYSKELRNNAWK